MKAGVCAPIGGNMQRWRFLVIRDPKVKETVGALYKRAWDEQVAPRYRAGEPAPGMSRERFLAAARCGGILGGAHSRGSGVDCPVPRRRHADPHVRVVDLSCGAEHAAGGESARPRRDSDDAVLAVRERGRGRVRAAAERPFICAAAGTVRHRAFTYTLSGCYPG
jgi:nitroreductase